MLYPNKYQSNEIDFEEYKQDSKRIIDFNDTVPIEFKEGEGWVILHHSEDKPITIKLPILSPIFRTFRIHLKGKEPIIIEGYRNKWQRLWCSLSLKLFGKCVIK
jgi:hypothetical protein